MEIPWLLFIYKVPAVPSRHRVALWRAVKLSGAIYLQNSVCIMPDSEKSRALFQVLAAQIREAGGESICLLATGLDESENEKIIQKFNFQRDQEYGEVIEQCQAFLEEICRETDRQNFSFAELEENQSNLERLETWFERISGRDFFGSKQKDVAASWLERCRSALERFASTVYEREGN
ncbi:MAG TPA: chromate resistance protein ChrB [Firmicutes bacterium]|nr:chromate resistance protein ChrB [Bacillota bacterium]